MPCGNPHLSNQANHMLTRVIILTNTSTPIREWHLIIFFPSHKPETLTQICHPRQPPLKLLSGPSLPRLFINAITIHAPTTIIFTKPVQVSSQTPSSFTNTTAVCLHTSYCSSVPSVRAFVKPATIAATRKQPRRKTQLERSHRGPHHSLTYRIRKNRVSSPLQREQRTTHLEA